MCTLNFILVFQSQLQAGRIVRRLAVVCSTGKMATLKADTLEDFMPHVLTSDTKRRLQTYTSLVDYLQSPGTTLACHEFDKMVDGLVNWINSSNFKVRLNLLFSWNLSNELC